MSCRDGRSAAQSIDTISLTMSPPPPTSMLDARCVPMMMPCRTCGAARRKRLRRTSKISVIFAGARRQWLSLRLSTDDADGIIYGSKDVSRDGTELDGDDWLSLRLSTDDAGLSTATRIGWQSRRAVARAQVRCQGSRSDGHVGGDVVNVVEGGAETAVARIERFSSELAASAQAVVVRSRPTGKHTTINSINSREVSKLNHYECSNT